MFDSDGLYFGLDDAWQNKKIRELNERLRSSRRDASKSRAEMGDDLDVLEDALGRALLLLHSLVNVCIQKGVLTKQDLDQMADQLDVADGRRDGKLEPESTIPEQQRPARTPSVQRDMRRLEKSDGANHPQDFLKDLEDGNLDDGNSS